VKSFDELKYAKMIAKRYSTDHHEYIVEPKALDILDKLSWFYDEPFGDASSIPTYYVSKMARQNVTVALSGDGGDENFAGYNRYKYSDMLRMGQAMMPAFAKRIASLLSDKLFYKNNNEWAIRLRNKLEEFYLDPFELYFKIISMYKEEEKQFLYSDRLRQKMAVYSTKEKFRKIYDACACEDYMSRLQYLDIKTYLCDDILVKVDRASMANSLEVRAPLLDYVFMEYIASLPSSLKVRHFSGKYVLKKAMARNIPSEILNRSKMGFGVPMANWLRGELRAAVEGELFDKKGIICELFDPGYVDKMWKLTLYGQPTSLLRKTDFSYRIWILFVLSRWFKTYMSS
jgi:asparagine synthase (glutamine-hydrolysing)